jgi:nucleoside-diphosphate-sugar epimerase
MRVFVTGAAGFVGTATIRCLQEAGHEVLGLARNDANAVKLGQAGVAVHRGDVTDLDSLREGARACDGVIHLAYIHDFSKFVENAEIDLRAVTAIVEVLEGTGKPLAVAGGTLMVAGVQRLATENDPDPNPDGPRSASAKLVLGAADRGVRSSVVRLAPSVHDRDRKGLVTYLTDLARQTGVSAYVGGGQTRWPAVHRNDAARLFQLAVEKAAPGSTLHAVAEEGVTMRAIAEALGESLDVPVKSLTPDEAAAHFGWMMMFAATDNPTSSAITRRTLGWNPTGPDLVTDIRESTYVPA